MTNPHFRVIHRRSLASARLSDAIQKNVSFAIAVYTPDAIEAQLDLAASTFLDGEVEVDSETRTIDANPILRWYRSDFGNLEKLINHHRSGGLTGRGWTFRWQSYDWSV